VAQIVGAMDITATGAISEEVEATRYFYIESPRLKTTPCTVKYPKQSKHHQTTPNFGILP